MIEWILVAVCVHVVLGVGMAAHNAYVCRFPSRWTFALDMVACLFLGGFVVVVGGVLYSPWYLGWAIGKAVSLFCEGFDDGGK